MMTVIPWSDKWYFSPLLSNLTWENVRKDSGSSPYLKGCGFFDVAKYGDLCSFNFGGLCDFGVVWDFGGFWNSWGACKCFRELWGGWYSSSATSHRIIQKLKLGLCINCSIKSYFSNPDVNSLHAYNMHAAFANAINKSAYECISIKRNLEWLNECTGWQSTQTRNAITVICTP